MNSNIPTRCNHWLCVDCWVEMTDHDEIVRYSVCRDDVKDWADRMASDGEEKKADAL